jgi:hypothetical protein
VVPAAAGSSPVAHLHKGPANGHVRADADRTVLRRRGHNGNSSSSTTAGTQGEEAGDEPPLRFVGDELDLYAEYHFELVQKIVRDVQYVSHENAEDAYAHA